MPKIQITEQDLTRTGNSSVSTDVVYIPGFVNTACDNLKDKTGKYIGIAYNKPTLFTSVLEFEALCGTSPACFMKDEEYPKAQEGRQTKDFAAAAVDTTSNKPVMFKKGTYDPSYIMAKELLAAGLNVLYERVNKQAESDQGESTETLVAPNIDVDTMYTFLSAAFKTNSNDEYKYGLASQGEYEFKYLTTGGYPVFEYDNNSIVTAMLNLAKQRGDCVAIIDHTDNILRDTNVNHSESVYGTVKSSTIFDDDGEFGAMFTPWCTYNRITSDQIDNTTRKSDPIRLPASFAYLKALADSIKTNANWLAIAGVTRGLVSDLSENGVTTNIPNGAADYMQPRQGIAVNAITNINPYGYTIWGNRTLKKNVENLTATSFLNIRNLISDVKKQTYKVAKRLTFEQNNEVLWVNFKAGISPLLDRMLTGYGISNYKIVRDLTHEKANETATVCAKIILYPVYAVEDFYITVVMTDDEVEVQ